MSSKKIETWEKERNILFLSKDINPNKKVTEEEFEALIEENSSNFITVVYDVRLPFLKANGYELSRENLANGELSVKIQE